MQHKTIQVSNPKALTADEFKAIQGSLLHSTMMKNRSVVTFPNNGGMSSKLLILIHKWMFENCNSTYHVAGDHPIRVYIEGDPDVINFKMYWQDQELPQLEDPVLPSQPNSAKVAHDAQIILEMMKLRRDIELAEKQQIAKERIAKERRYQFDYSKDAWLDPASNETIENIVKQLGKGYK